MQRVLVADDDQVLREVVAEALIDEGYEVRTASDGRAALALIVEGWRPDVILLDLMMPVMDGRAFRAAQRKLAGARDVPIIVFSAAHDARQACRDLGATQCLEKPFHLEALLDIVKVQLAASAPCDARQAATSGSD